MDAVTDELTEMMLHFLDPSSIISCAQVCQRFNRIITKSSRVQLRLHRYLHGPTQLDPVNGCATTYSSTPSHVLLTSLKERESNFASFSPKHSTLSIGPDERILAAYGQRIITSRAKALPVLDQGVSKWAAMVEYKETVDGDLRTWAKKKHLWDFEPLRISVDLERDLVMASEVYRGEDRSMIKFFSLSGDPIPCREKHLRWSGQSRNLEGGPRRTMFGPLNSFIVVAPPSLNIFSLFDGQQLAAITIPGGIKSSHVIQCVWPNYITISSSIIWTWAGNPDKDAGLDQRLFIYDLNNILLSNKDKPGPKIVNKPHYKLIYPRAISDLPPHIHKKLQEIYPDKVPRMCGSWHGDFHKSGIIQLFLSLCELQRYPHPGPSYDLLIYIDINRLLESLSRSKSRRTEWQIIPLKKWYPFSYMHLEESNRDEGWGGNNRSIAGSKAFAWKRMRYTDEIKIYCHDLNQRILRFKGDMGSALGGGKSMFMPQVVTSKEEDIRKKDSPFTNISVTRSEITSESLGAITRKAVCKLEKTDGLWPTMRFDGERLFLQHQQLIPSECKEPKVEIYDFR